MGYSQTDTVEGAKFEYKLAPEAKRYTLRDNGFKETKAGNFQLIMPLNATPQSKEGFKLKITVDKELNGFKMSVTTANGLKSFNIFKDEKNQLVQEKFYFLMDGMIDRGLFTKSEK